MRCVALPLVTACSLAALSGATISTLWQPRAVTNESFVHVAALASGLSGTLAAGGTYGGSITLPSGHVVTSSGSSDGFVAEIDSSTGEARWFASLGGSAADEPIGDFGGISEREAAAPSRQRAR